MRAKNISDTPANRQDDCRNIKHWNKEARDQNLRQLPRQMPKQTSILAVALQMLAAASLLPKTVSAAPEEPLTSKASISQRVAKVRQSMMDKVDGVTLGEKGTNVSWYNYWGKWHNWHNWHNGWRNWHNWRNY